jgi:hypothetical protein
LNDFLSIFVDKRNLATPQFVFAFVRVQYKPIVLGESPLAPYAVLARFLIGKASFRSNADTIGSR